jgi:hypothetical protein
MDTFFAPPERSPASEFEREVAAVSANPVIDGLMNMATGLVAVLNQRRQILAVNDVFLQTLGLKGADNLLGLRPGEAIGCAHAPKTPGGCGTGKFCASCGAALAIVTSLGRNRPVERTCAITTGPDDGRADLFLQVKACPIPFDRQRLVLLFLQDITLQQQWASLGRVFFHDISNIISILVLASDLLMEDGCAGCAPLVREINAASQRLAREVEMQRHLTQSGDGKLAVRIRRFTLQQVIDDIQAAFAHHPAARGKSLQTAIAGEPVTIHSDLSLLMRVIDNMLINAFEGSETSDSVRLWAQTHTDAVTFHVRNRAPIPEAIAGRVFQRNVSSKSAAGRGLGTYSMKLFGEKYLGGRLTFTSSEAEGTQFSFRLPLTPPPGIGVP